MKTLLKILTAFTILFPLRAAAATPEFVDAADYFNGAAAYYDGIASLARQFDDLCGDTFCEGDFSNLTALAFDCSVEKSTGALGQCVWTFAGSYSEVDAATGHVAVKRTVKGCKLPVKGDAQALLAFLAKAGKPGPSYHEGLYATVLPGDATGRTLMDVLSACL